MLRIRLSMGGVRKRPIYKIVIADGRYPRDGKFIEKIGSYNPLLPKDKKERIKIEAERVKYWMSKGAQPTLRVSRLLGELQIMPMPKPGNNPQKAIPKKDRKKSAEESKEAPKEEGKKEDSKAIEKAKGVIFYKGIGELPFIQQATISIWKNNNFINDFAYKEIDHATIIKKTRKNNWYKEDLFSRFLLISDSTNKLN